MFPPSTSHRDEEDRPFQFGDQRPLAINAGVNRGLTINTAAGPETDILPRLGRVLDALRPSSSLILDIRDLARFCANRSS
jgi:hypothetical protein